MTIRQQTWLPALIKINAPHMPTKIQTSTLLIGLLVFGALKQLGEWANTVLIVAIAIYFVVGLAWIYGERAFELLSIWRTRRQLTQFVTQLAAAGIIEVHLKLPIEAAMEYSHRTLDMAAWKTALDHIQRRRFNGHETNDEELVLRRRIMELIEEWKADGLGNA